MTDIQTLKQKLYEQKNRLGLVGGTVDVKEYDETEHNITAHINPNGWDIEIEVRKGFNPIRDRRQKAYARKKKIIDGLETLVCHVGGLHEPAHWELPLESGKGCPFDLHYHDKILEAIKNALPKNKQGMVDYVANAFEDMIINPRCREFNGDYSGGVLFWDNEGLSCKKKGQKAFNPFYEAFVKLNMHLFGDNLDRALLKRHYSNDKKVEKAVSNVVKHLSLSENIKDTRVLFNKENWSQMAEIFARDLAELLDEMPSERLSAFSGEQGEGSRADSREKKQAGNGIEKKMGTKEGAEEVAFGRYASGDKLSPHFTSYEQLDSLYQRLARDIPINVEAMTRAHSMQIDPLNFRAFDEEKDDPAKIRASKIFVTDGGIQFGYRNQHLTVMAKEKVQRKSFPDFKVVMLDNSGSMKEAIDGSSNAGRTETIPWGDRSKYHFALLGFYGIENFLQRQGIAQYIGHGISLFSSQTRYDEGEFNRIEELRKKALAPDWGGTNLDASVLVQALRGRESFMISLSDGEIANWNSEKNKFRECLENNHYAHIQIGGGRTAFTNDLESWKVPVFYVSSGEELSRLMVDTARDTYRRYTTQ